MRFAFTEEQAMIAETAKAFFAENATSERTRAAMAKTGVDDALWGAFTQELGLAGVAVSESFGGVGLGMVELAILAEEAGRNTATLPFLSSLGLAASAIQAGGSEAQKQRWLPKLASGELIASFAIANAEDTPGATLGDGMLTGAALHVPHGARADLYVVAAHNGVAIVERSAPGLSVTPLTTMDQTRPYARLDFGGVAAEALADGDAGLKAALSAGCLMIAADSLGGAQACLERTVAYAQERVQFGRVIGSFQAVKHRLADMMVEIEQSRSAVYWAACAMDEGSDEAAMAVHAAKAFACDTYQKCAGEMIQLHGGIGFTWEHDAHLYFKRARSNASLLGTPDWHREEVAKLTGLDEAA
ncbi:acyl-CoA dehydrogenase family protein [Sphingomonas sp. C3-2]|uniref:acyl-CoA dehydrogenase family protein n=1 Tax=Sphingomonas sp. C3-2 TaxID=3062169 RepID=UPI00294B39F4|nr:acyl-CoA dehydrogenase family protein [Sphingomonas sp. C3-2]WOK37410.1 acyl-CoA dehydrogenase family protein [Sphingomonas sp. C3-2]